MLIPLAAASAGHAAAVRDADGLLFFTSCTTRSDTFAVYGYMEALKANSGVANNNTTDWYTGTYSDDPNNTTAQFIRVAKRRFLAILDRSWCNVPRTGTYAAGNNSASDSSGNVYLWTGTSGASTTAPPGTNWVQVGVIPPTAPSGTVGTYRLPKIVAIRDLPQ